MAVFTCEKCGSNVDTRCKPKKCPACGESGVMCKERPPRRPRREEIVIRQGHRVPCPGYGLEAQASGR